MKIQLKRLTETAILPTYGTSDAAGADLHADIARQVVIGPGERATIPTGISIALPPGLALLVCPRSGLSHKSGITVHNGPGVIDADYRGGIGVILHNTTHQQFVVNPGDRVAQGVIVPVLRAEWDEVEELPDSVRGEGGFGSTGLSVTVKGDEPSKVAGKVQSQVRSLIEATLLRQSRPGGLLHRGGPIMVPAGERMVRLSPGAEIGYRALSQEMHDRKSGPGTAPGSSESHAKDAPALHTLEGMEPEEAAVALMRAA